VCLVEIYATAPQGGGRVEFAVDDFVLKLLSANANIETLWIGKNVLSNPASFPHILEIGDSTTGANAGDATSSSGIKRTYAIAATEAKVTGWALPVSMSKAADGGHFKVFARFPTGTNVTSVNWRIKILYSGTVIWEGDQTLFDDTNTTARLWRELDTIKLPPWAPEGDDVAAITFELWGERIAGAVSVAIDHLILLPMDGYRKLKSHAGIFPTNSFVDDGIIKDAYHEQSDAVASYMFRDIIQTGQQMTVNPNEDQRFYFMNHSPTANTSVIDHPMTVEMWYRPRRKTL